MIKSPVYDKVMSSYPQDESSVGMKLYTNIRSQIRKSKEASLKAQKQASKTKELRLDTNTQVESSEPSKASSSDFNASYRDRTYSQPKRNTPGCADCSSYTRDYYRSKGKDIGTYTGSQWDNSKYVTVPKDGDLAFWDTGGSGMNHVGIYKGNGNMDHFSTKGLREGVSISGYGSGTNKFLGYRTFN